MLASSRQSPGGEDEALRTFPPQWIEFRGAFLLPTQGMGGGEDMASKSLISGALWLGFAVFVAAIIGGAFH